MKHKITLTVPYKCKPYRYCAVIQHSEFPYVYVPINFGTVEKPGQADFSQAALKMIRTIHGIRQRSGWRMSDYTQKEIAILLTLLIRC